MFHKVFSPRPSRAPPFEVKLCDLKKQCPSPLSGSLSQLRLATSAFLTPHSFCSLQSLFPQGYCRPFFTRATPTDQSVPCLSRPPYYAHRPPICSGTSVSPPSLCCFFVLFACVSVFFPPSILQARRDGERGPLPCGLRESPPCSRPLVLDLCYSYQATFDDCQIGLYS